MVRQSWEFSAPRVVDGVQATKPCWSVALPSAAVHSACKRRLSLQLDGGQSKRPSPAAASSLHEAVSQQVLEPGCRESRDPDRRGAVADSVVGSAAGAGNPVEATVAAEQGAASHSCGHDREKHAQVGFCAVQRLLPPLRRNGKTRCVVVHGYQQVRRCNPSLVEQAKTLLFRHGWPLSEDAATRQHIVKLFGQSGKHTFGRANVSAHLGWVTQPRGALRESLVAVAILSVYRYRDSRRCGCLEFIVSRMRGAGTELVERAKEQLEEENIPRLYSGADLSRKVALRAHLRWGFRGIEEDEWSRAGLQLYGEGDVCYMSLDLSARTSPSLPPSTADDVETTPTSTRSRVVRGIGCGRRITP